MNIKLIMFLSLAKSTKDISLNYVQEKNQNSIWSIKDDKYVPKCIKLDKGCNNSKTPGDAHRYKAFDIHQKLTPLMRKCRGSRGILCLFKSPSEFVDHDGKWGQISNNRSSKRYAEVKKYGGFPIQPANMTIGVIWLQVQRNSRSKASSPPVRKQRWKLAESPSHIGCTLQAGCVLPERSVDVG